MAAFQQAQLERTLEVLRASQSPSTETQTKVQDVLKEYSKNPDFNRYLLYVMVGMPKESVETRAVAGIVLKNNIKKMYPQLEAQAPAILEGVKAECIKHIGNADQLIRATIGLIVTSIVQHGGLAKWPSLMQTLLTLIRNPDPNVCQGAFWTLHKICEDTHREMVAVPGLIEVMIPALMQFFQNEDPKIRTFSLACINTFILDKPAALEAGMQVLLPAIFKIAFDPDPDVRKNVCQAIVSFQEVSWEHIKGHLAQIIEYMLRCTVDKDDEVALEACEFWLSITEEIEAIPILAPFLPKLVPLLLTKMVYSDLDIMMLRGDEDDAHVADREQDVKPHVIKNRAGGAGAGAAVAGGGGGGGGGAGAADEDEDDYDDEWDEEDDDDDDAEEWSLRKCAAAGLDVLSTVYGDECPDEFKALIPGGNGILPLLLPHLQSALQSPNWEIKEAGVLAVGAVAEGCMEGMEPHLPQIVPFLIGTLADTKPLVRSITCWTLSRYAVWITAPIAREAKLLHNFVDNLLKRVLDGNKKVQEAACSALAVLEEEAQELLVPYISFILQALAQAFGTYQKRNLLILYDAIGTLAESVKDALKNPAFVQILMPPLMQKWHTIPNDDRELLPLLECLQTVALALGDSFLPYCEILHHRCVDIVKLNLKQNADCIANPAAFEAPDPDFLIVPLDLLSALAEAVGVAVESLVAKFQIMAILAQCGQFAVPEVRQSAFALLGDYSQVCFVHVKPHFGNFVMLLAQHLDPKHTSVCNNAAWAIGEIAVQCAVQGLDLNPLLQYVMQPLFVIMAKQQDPAVQRSLRMVTLMENTGITIGRVAAACPQQVGAHLQHFIKPWCLAMRNIRANEEKHQAFVGICRCIVTNPRGVMPELIFFCDAVCSWGEDAPPDLQLAFRQLLQGFKREAEAAQAGKWETYFAAFPPELKEPLRAKYGV